MRITKTRLAALRIIQQNPGIDAHSICWYLYQGDHIRWKEYLKSDAPKYMSGPSGQSSARWSGAFIKPLISEELISRKMMKNSGYRYGLFITSKGRDILFAPKPNDKE